MRPTRSTARPLLAATCAAVGVGILLCGCGSQEPTSTTRHEPTEIHGEYIAHTGSSARPQGERSWTDPLRFTYYGLPRRDGVGAAPTALFNDGYVVGYDMERKLPLWASWRLYAGGKAEDSERERERERGVPRADDRLGPAPAVPEHERREPPPWLGLAPHDPLAALYGNRAGEETRLSSDALFMTPPAGWAELEERERAWARSARELWVLDGPLFATADPKDLTLVGGWRIEVRVSDGQTKAQAFLLPNASKQEERERRDHPIDLASLQVTIETVTRRTGLTFFPDLHDTDRTTRHQVLTVMPLGPWPMAGDGRTASR